jgi:hypothetical protein
MRVNRSGAAPVNHVEGIGIDVHLAHAGADRSYHRGCRVLAVRGCAVEEAQPFVTLL